MWGAVIRGVLTFLGGMLVATLVTEVLTQFLDIITPDLATGHVLVTSLQGVRDNFVLIVILGVVIALIARATVESRLGGGY